MIVGIDASNIRAGGGVTHLVELLRAADPQVHGFSQVIVWSGLATLNRIDDRPWLVKIHQPILDKSLPYRTFWQCFKLCNQARMVGCDVLFVPGGSYAGNFHPIVTFSQNLLPFEWRELRRYGWSFFTIKMMFLRWTQSRTFRKADGVIFLTQYAQDAVMRAIGSINGQSSIVPHGIDGRFSCPPRKQLAVNHYSDDRPFRLLYVSVIDQYKHQWHVAEAVVQLRKSGLPVELDLVGPASPPALKRLRDKLERVDPAGHFVRYTGAVPYAELHTRYTEADAFVFASSCETFGQILIEAMSAGLPIACSKRSAMPELLGDAGVYFDPERPGEIAEALRSLYNQPVLRRQLAGRAYTAAQDYSWERCAQETFSFIAQVAGHRQTAASLLK
ncbi:MAG: glycosyltransferase family 4 protein [Proteobacteria bacterium]|nr:glycosyltransferase family 4 protein [Desulfocapsa sp.]MBU3943848.1 glycosyltransferase family 4 protein [Pseudomonadota bacterium]MCG2745782.1 glycosyltransferase family 4 protein [Desulfobacteraceae bacterium]MBU3984379.1 glycosyltransferase family 4 protein [Pseudomonadota bacterium]MBU4028003.1 glycosyltransferase family 4 protein [Pseudomonadota bacterium]